MKELTGQDPITARFLYQEYFEFIPVFKLWLACNHVPVIHGQEKGIWRRIRLIPFTVEFHDADSPDGPYKDNRLPDKLRAEYPGILAWVLRGCLEWQTNGLPAAVAVKAATGKLQQDMDVLGGFLSECCVFHHNAQDVGEGPIPGLLPVDRAGRRESRCHSGGSACGLVSAATARPITARRAISGGAGLGSSTGARTLGLTMLTMLIWV